MGRLSVSGACLLLSPHQVHGRRMRHLRSRHVLSLSPGVLQGLPSWLSVSLPSCQACNRRICYFQRSLLLLSAVKIREIHFRNARTRSIHNRANRYRSITTLRASPWKIPLPTHNSTAQNEFRITTKLPRQRVNLSTTVINAHTTVLPYPVL